MKSLTKHVLRYFVDADAIDIDNVMNTPFEEPSSQLDEESLEEGEEARLLAEEF